VDFQGLVVVTGMDNVDVQHVFMLKEQLEFIEIENLNCANQRFTCSLVTEMAHKGYFICECCGDDKAIGVTGEIRAGSPLQVHDINTKSPKQIFRLEINYNDGDNYWCIISCDTDKNLVWEIEDESSKSGKRLILGRRTNNKNQRFCLNNGDSYK